MADDYFGFDASQPRTTDAPAGYEGVHEVGYSWAVEGTGYADTSRVTADQWNHLIAQFRGLSSDPNIDVSDLAIDSPLLLQGFIERYATYRIATILAGEDVPGYGVMLKSDYDEDSDGNVDFAHGGTGGSYADASALKIGLGIDTDISDAVDAAVAALVDSSPAALDTLSELAASLGDDPDFAGSMVTALAAKADDADLTTVSDALDALVAKFNTISRRNLLTNGMMQVAQRGDGPFTSASSFSNTDGDYLIDGWVLLTDGFDRIDLSRVNNDNFKSKKAMRWDIESSNKKFAFMAPLRTEQIREAVFEGKVSLQVRLDGNPSGFAGLKIAVIEWTGTANSITRDCISSWNGDGVDPTLATNWAYCTDGISALIAPDFAGDVTKLEDITVSSSATNLAVLIFSTDLTTTIAETGDIGDVQLEVGSFCTAIEVRDPSEDLALCRRSFQYDDIPGLWYDFVPGNGTGNQSLYWNWQRDVKMWADPSGDYSNVSLSTGSIGSTQSEAVAFMFRTSTSYAAGTTSTASGFVLSSCEL